MSEAVIFTTAFNKTVGTQHIVSGKPCEDSVSRAVSADGLVTCVSLSDGAGSCKYALEGSSLAAETGAAVLADNFEMLWGMDDSSAGEYIINEVCRPIARAAEANNRPMDSMLATLLCACMHKDGRYIIFHVGDGVVLGYSPEKSMVVLSQYEHIYASNIATFVNVPGTDYKLMKGSGDYCSFMLTSDGAEPYLIVDGIASAPLVMMQQACFVLTESDIVVFMQDMFDMLQQSLKATDDLSFAVIADNRRTADVVESMKPLFTYELLNMPVPKRRSALKMHAEMVKVLKSHPEGISYDALDRVLYTHGKKRLLKKLETMNFIEISGGRVYLK